MGVGHRVGSLETAEDGLDLIKNYRFDIIIVDYRLPGMDGLEFIKNLPVTQADSLKVLITAYERGDLFKLAKRSGVHEFISKPFTTKTIEDSLNRMIAW